MSSLAPILPYIQIILSVLLVTGVLLQRSEAGLGAGFGGSGGDTLGGNYHTKRGPEKVLFIATVVIAILFLIASFLALLV